MSEAKYENDDYLQDIEGLKFEERLAKYFGKQAAVLFPTASMANLASVMVHTSPGSEAIVPSSAHGTERECSSFAIIAGVQLRQIITKSGLFTVEEGT